MWEIERLPQVLVEEVYDFIAFVQKRRGAKDNGEMSWSNFSLSSGSFEF